MSAESPSNMLICGMHRSGTSLTGKFLENIGYNFGTPDELLKPQAFNKEGFWERTDVIKLNNKVLMLFGSSWDYPLHIQKEKVREIAVKNLLNLADEAKGIIQKLQIPYAIKDPRISLVLPFWQEIIPSHKIIIAVRNPLEVAKSLGKRNRISMHLGLMLWQKYYQILLTHSHESERFFLFNESLLEIDQNFITAIQKYLNLNNAETVRNAIHASVNKSLITHHYPSPENILKSPHHKEIINIWRLMRTEAGYVDHYNGKLEQAK